MQASITLQLKDKVQLQAAYMNFIAHGGLFIATTEDYTLHQLLTVNLQLWSGAPITFAGKIVWLNQQQVPGVQVPGIGVQLPAAAHELQKKIEHLLKDDTYDC